MKPYRHPCRQDPEAFLFTEGIDFFELPPDASFMGERRRGVVELCAGTTISGAWIDLGSGDGRYTELLLSRCAQVIAIDADRSALSKLWHRMPEAARERLELKVHNVVEPLPLPDGSMDGALCVGLLHYLPSELVDAAVLEVHRVLRPGGTFLLELSTDVRRLPVGEGSSVRRGTDRCFEDARALLAGAFARRFEYEMFEESVDREPMLLFGRPFTWSSRDIHVRAVKRGAGRPDQAVRPEEAS